MLKIGVKKSGKDPFTLVDQGEPPINLSTCTKAVKVLHVLFQLNPGGLENWLLQVLRRLDRQRFEIDFLVHHPEKGLYEDQAVALGGRVLRLPYTSTPLHYGREFRRLLAEHGPYQAIHSHLALGGFHLRWAHQAGIPLRIVHTHADEEQRRHTASLRRRLTLNLSRYLIRRYATLGLAVSRQAAQGRFGPDWQDDPRFQILPCAIPLDSFTGRVDGGSVRRSLGLPESAFVLGHVGRLVPEKNHGLLIDLAAEVCRRRPKAYLLLVGDGPLRQQLELQVRSLGLAERVVFTGFRNDISEILQGAVDLFLFPSKYESAGMAVVEAQAAGLPCLISDTIPEEVVVIPELVQRVSLTGGPRGWAEAVLAHRHRKAFKNPLEAAGQIRGTLFDLETNVRHLEAFYARALLFGARVSGQRL